jgi:hypothetical protein
LHEFWSAGFRPVSPKDDVTEVKMLSAYFCSFELVVEQTENAGIFGIPEDSEISSRSGMECRVVHFVTS